MVEISVNNKIALFLDHRKSINELYKKSTDISESTYELNSNLFSFHAKQSKLNENIKQSPQDQSNKLNSGKRKYQLEESTSQEKVIEREWCDQVIQNIKNLNYVSKSSNEFRETIRLWEEPNEFPQFNGKNCTKTFQKVKFNTITYIIPPECKFFNFNCLEITQLLPQLPSTYDIIIMDPPWRNKYIRRLKKCRQSLAYAMLTNTQLKELPIAQLIHKQSIVMIWCTNSQYHQESICNNFLPSWNLRFLHKLKWYKLNTDGDLIGPIGEKSSDKQPYEMLYLACHREAADNYANALKEIEALFSIPSIIHSHKPPIGVLLNGLFPENAKSLELFARYLQPHQTSIGLEVIKLMDIRLYNQTH